MSNLDSLIEVKVSWEGGEDTLTLKSANHYIDHQNDLKADVRKALKAKSHSIASRTQLTVTDLSDDSEWTMGY